MAKKEEIFKTIVIFLFFLFGCNHKYVDVEGELSGGSIVALWEELDCKIVEQDEQGFSLGFQVKNVAVVSGSAKLVELYERSSREKEDGRTPLGLLVGFGGCIGGCYYGLSDNNFWDGYDKDRFDRGCLISFASCATGLGIVFWGIDHSRKVAKAVPNFIKRDTICVDSMFLSKQKIKISVERLDFAKMYYTDEDGNIELKFDEILPEPTDADSVLSIIMRYYELVDTVRVRRL